MSSRSLQIKFLMPDMFQKPSASARERERESNQPEFRGRNSVHAVAVICSLQEWCT